MCSRDKELTIKGTENCLAAATTAPGLLSRYRRTASVDRATDRSQRTTHAARAGNSGNGGTGRPRRGSGPVSASGPGLPPPATAPSNEAAPSHQDSRNPRPGIVGQRDDPKLFEAARMCSASTWPHAARQDAWLVATIRNVESSYGRPIGILVDLQGPKLRLARSPKVRPNSRTARVLCSIPTRRRATTTRAVAASGNPRSLAAGHALLLDDGKVRLIAEETSPSAR